MFCFRAQRSVIHVTLWKQNIEETFKKTLRLGYIGFRVNISKRQYVKIHAPFVY